MERSEHVTTQIYVQLLHIKIVAKMVTVQVLHCSRIHNFKDKFQILIMSACYVTDCINSLSDVPFPKEREL
jgi:hypothetical protein